MSMYKLLQTKKKISSNTVQQDIRSFPLVCNAVTSLRVYTCQQSRTVCKYNELGYF